MSEQTRYKPWQYERPPFGEFGGFAMVGERLCCHVCGRDYLNLGTHVHYMHGMSANEYKDAFMLVRETPLWAASVSRKLTAANTRRLQSEPRHMADMTELARARRPAHRHTTASREAIGAAARARMLSPATRAAMSEATRNRITPATRAALAAASRNQWLGLSEDERSQRMRHIASFPIRDETTRRERISAAMRGRKVPWVTGGEGHSTAKLTWDKVRRIRELAAAGRAYSAIAAEIPGATKSNVFMIVRRKTWTNDPQESQ